MYCLSNLKITRKLIAVGTLSIIVAFLLSAGFRYSIYLEEKLQQEEVFFHEMFEKMWHILLDLEKSYVVVEKIFSTKSQDHLKAFLDYDKDISEDISELKEYLKNDTKAFNITEAISKAQVEYVNSVNDLVQDYSAIGLGDNVIEYMPSSKLISEKLLKYKVPYYVVSEWSGFQQQELFLFYNESELLSSDYIKKKNIVRSLFESFSVDDVYRKELLTLFDTYQQRFDQRKKALTIIQEKKKSLFYRVKTYKQIVGALKVHGDEMFLQLNEHAKKEKDFLLASFYLLVVISLFILTLVLYVVVKNVGESTKRIKDVLKGFSQGSAVLTDRLPEEGRNEMSEIAHWFNVFMDKLQASMIDVSDLSCHLTEVAITAQQRRDETSAVLEDQVECVHNISSLMDVMGKQVMQVTDDAKEAANSASTASENAVSGAAVVTKLIQSMNVLASNIEGTTQSVVQLDEHGKSIHGVITMIQQIAEQTNLLALNAAIEAARAGESGRGFAVVADEVRNLSMRTTEATSEIHNIISILQNSTTTVVDAMTKSREQAAEGVGLANQADSSLHSITESVVAIEKLNEKMLSSTLVNQQANSDILENFIPVRTAIDEITASSKQSISDSADLSQTAAMMQNITAGFGMSAATCPIDTNIADEDDSSQDEGNVELF